LESGQVSAAHSIHEALGKIEMSADLKAILYSQQAVVAIAQNRSEDATTKVSQALKENPRCVQALFARSLVEQSGGGIDQAGASIQEAMELDLGNARLTARKAELAFGSGNIVEAARLAEVAMDKNPDDSDARSLRGFILLARGEIAPAVEEFNRALAARSPPASAHLGLGIATIRSGDKDAGRIEIQKAVHLEPTNSLFRSYLGKALFESNRLDTAEEELNTAKKLDPLDPTPYLYDAFNKLATFRPIEALEAVEDSIERNENRFVYRSKFMLDRDQATRAVGLGRVFATLDFVQPARIAALRSLAEDPTNYSAHYLLKDTLLGSNADAAITVPSEVTPETAAAGTKLPPESFTVITEIGLRAKVASVHVVASEQPDADPEPRTYLYF
jgi:Flp pilus assembly protein TadD